MAYGIRRTDGLYTDTDEVTFKGNYPVRSASISIEDINEAYQYCQWCNDRYPLTFPWIMYYVIERDN